MRYFGVFSRNDLFELHCTDDAVDEDVGEQGEDYDGEYTAAEVYDLGLAVCSEDWGGGEKIEGA